MDLAKMTLQEFMCEGPNQMVAPGSVAVYDLLSMVGTTIPIDERIRELRDGYELHRIRNEPGDVCIVREGRVVGAYITETLVVDEKHQRRGLAVVMILEAVKDRPKPTKRNFSPEGKLAIAKAWRVANDRAQRIKAD